MVPNRCLVNGTKTPVPKGRFVNHMKSTTANCCFGESTKTLFGIDCYGHSRIWTETDLGLLRPTRTDRPADSDNNDKDTEDKDDDDNDDD